MICSVWIREGWLSCCQLKSWASLKNHYRTDITALSLICQDLTLGRNPTFKDKLKDFVNVADVTATFSVRGSFKTSVENEVPHWTVSIENYRNTEQSMKTSKSFFESSVQHNPTACTFTQKMPTIAWVARIFKGNSPNLPLEKATVFTPPARSSFVSLSYFLSDSLK